MLPPQKTALGKLLQVAPDGHFGNAKPLGKGKLAASGVRATLVLAGRSLTGAARPNATLTDFLDTAENQDGNSAFEQKKVSKTFNDRFVTLSNY